MYEPQYVMAAQRNEPVKWLTKTEQLYTYIAALLIFLFLGWYWGFQYEEFTDVFFNTGLSGAVTGKPTGFFYNYLNLTFISWVIAFLYLKIPGVPWYGGMLVLAMLINTALLIQLTWLLRRHNSFGFYLLLLTLPFWAENFLFIQYTRVSFFTAAIPLLVFTCRQLSVRAESRLSTGSAIFYNTLLIWSALIRLEPITLVVFFLIVFGIIAGVGRKLIIPACRFFMPMFITLLALWLMINVSFTSSDKKYHEFRAFTNTLWDFSQGSSFLKLKTKRDSVIFYTTSNYFLNDPGFINGSAFTSMGLVPKDKTPFSIAYYINDYELIPGKISNFIVSAHLKNLNAALLALFVLITGLAIVIGFRLSALKYILLHVSFWSILFLIAVFMKIEDRIFLPTILLLCYFSSISMLYLKTNTSAFYRLIQVVSVAGLIWGSYASYSHLVSKMKISREAKQYIAQVHTETEKLFPRKLLIYNLWSYNLFFQSPLDASSTPDRDKAISIDNGLLFMLPAYEIHAKKFFGTTHLKEIFKQCIGNKEEIVFVSDNSRMKLLQQYLKTIYAIDLKYHIVHPEAAINQPHIFLNWNTNFTFHYFQLE